MAHAVGHPDREGQLALGAHQAVEHLLEALVARAQPVELGVQRRGEQERRLVGGHVLGRGRRQPDHMQTRIRGLSLFSQLVEGRSHEVAPRGDDVVALVEDDRAHAGLAQPVEAGQRRGGHQLARVAPAGDLGLEGGDRAHQLVGAAAGRRARPQPRLGRGAQCAVRVVGRAQGLVGQRGDRAVCRPLRLIAAVGPGRPPARRGAAPSRGP
jgi:hypothetical protein